MIKKSLQNHYNLGKLYSSYLINVDSIDKALEEVEAFIKENILINAEGNLKSHSDYFLVEKIDSKAKNISVDQIRSLQTFLHKSSVISGKKVAVIYAADRMNLNASNSCLKILEEPTNNTYLFLLTENAASLLPTIISRCAKINHHYNDGEKYIISEKFIKPLLKSTTLSDRLAFIKEFASKDRDLWVNFSLSAQKLLAKFSRVMAGLPINITDDERELLSQFQSNSPIYLQSKYDLVTKMINEVNEFDLDLRASATLLIDKFRK